MQSTIPKNAGYLPTLDGWRTIAILAVIIDHGVAYGFGERYPALFSATRIGQNGVSLFFAISGFLICSRLLEEERVFGAIGLRGFYIRRACRILPPAMTYLAVIGALALFGAISVSARDWCASALFFRNYLPPSLIGRGWGGYTIHYWSLAVEEHFYLLWPPILAVSGSRRAKWAAITMSCACALWRQWDFHHHLVNKYLPGLLVGTRTDIRMDGLLMGCLAALLLADSKWSVWCERLITLRTWMLSAFVYLLIQVSRRHHDYTIWESILLALLVAGTVLRPHTWVGRWLETSWLRFIGKLSYSLYLWQQLFLVPQAKYPISLLQRFPVNLALLFVMALVSYYYIERPMIRVGHKLAPPPTTGRADGRPISVSSAHAAAA